MMSSMLKIYQNIETFSLLLNFETLKTFKRNALLKYDSSIRRCLCYYIINAKYMYDDGNVSSL